jgi:hypothetical protein
MPLFWPSSIPSQYMFSLHFHGNRMKITNKLCPTKINYIIITTNVGKETA